MAAHSSRPRYAPCSCFRCTRLSGLLVPTINGWKNTLTVLVGDTVFDETGHPCTVTWIGEVLEGLPCFEIAFDDGTVVAVDEQHRWLTWDKSARKAAAPGRRISHPLTRAPRWQCTPYAFPTVVSTSDIAETIWYSPRERNHSIPVTLPLNYQTKTLPIAPYTFGAWLGDGVSMFATLACSEPEILSHVEADGYKIVPHRVIPPKTPMYGIGGQPQSRDPNTGRLTSNDSINSILKKIGVSNNKHIPRSYLESDTQQRFSLLEGLMDTDGYADKQSRCEIISVNQHMARDMLELILGLGFKPTYKEERTRLRGRDCGPKYRINFTPHVPVFRLQRKLDRQHSGRTQLARTHHRYITEVVPTKSFSMRRIVVDSASQLYLCSNALIPTYGGLY